MFERTQIKDTEIKAGLRVHVIAEDNNISVMLPDGRYPFSTPRTPGFENRIRKYMTDRGLIPWGWSVQKFPWLKNGVDHAQATEIKASPNTEHRTNEEADPSSGSQVVSDARVLPEDLPEGNDRES